MGGIVGVADGPLAGVPPAPRGCCCAESVVRRLTRMPVCIDPSHSVGSRDRAPDGLMDVMHVTAQGVIAGANMVLVDFHPEPSSALVDGPQALTLTKLAGRWCRKEWASHRSSPLEGEPYGPC